MIRTIRAALTQASARLRDAGIDSSRLEARLLLAQATGLPREKLLLDQDRAVETADFDALVTRRAAHEPLALILGHREFWGLDFAVSAATLIPRPDSETLIEAALDAFANRAPPARVLDLGTGTGCLLLAALTEFVAAFGVGVDRSPAAAALGARNAASLGLADRCAWVCGDWAEALTGRFDLVLGNPPYIRHADIAGLMPEVAQFEPASALDGGEDGLDAYRRIIADLPNRLLPNAMAILEAGQGQAGDVAEIAEDAGFEAQFRDDLAGIQRAVILHRPIS